jgi:hypothetical protein
MALVAVSALDARGELIRDRPDQREVDAAAVPPPAASTLSARSLRRAAPPPQSGKAGWNSGGRSSRRP